MSNANRKTGRKRQKGSGYKYDTAFKMKVAKAYLESNLTLKRVSETFNVSHQNVSTWAQEFSSQLAPEEIIKPMTEEEQKDNAALKKRNEALTKNLEHERMKNFALEAMIDLGKEKLGVDLRKNFGAKQPKE
jgi:transposase-like protein